MKKPGIKSHPLSSVCIQQRICAVMHYEDRGFVKKLSSCNFALMSVYEVYRQRPRF